MYTSFPLKYNELLECKSNKLTIHNYSLVLHVLP